MQILFQLSLALATPCPKSSIHSNSSVQDENLHEISGVAQHQDRIFVHNDSGDDANIYVMNVMGQHLETKTLEGVRARDWEDLSIALWNGEPTLFVGDIGDNQEQYKAVFIHALPVNSSPPFHATTWKLNYGEYGSQDAEGLAFDPTNGRLYLLSKGRSGTINLFQSDVLSSTISEPSLTLIAQFPLSDRRKPLPAFLATGLDISPSGQQLIMRNYMKAFLWRKTGTETWAETLAKPPCPIRLPKQPQGESIAFTSEDELMTISERSHQPIYYIRLMRNQP